MTTTRQLEDTARDLCTRLVAPLFGPQIHVRVEGTSSAWHGTLLREVYSQSASVWRRFARFHVTVDELGEVIGFADEDAYGGCDDTSDLSSTEIEHLVADEPAIPGRTAIVWAKRLPCAAGGTMIRVRCRLAQPRAAYAELTVEINPARRIIALVRPEFTQEPGT